EVIAALTAPPPPELAAARAWLEGPDHHLLAVDDPRYPAGLPQNEECFLHFIKSGRSPPSGLHCNVSVDSSGISFVLHLNLNLLFFHFQVNQNKKATIRHPVNRLADQDPQTLTPNADPPSEPFGLNKSANADFSPIFTGTGRMTRWD
ncbi:MAG: hypothetical protein R6V48_05710, partial [Fidelibacterota bacterium]